MTSRDMASSSVLERLDKSSSIQGKPGFTSYRGKLSSTERPRILHFLCTEIRAGVAEHVISLATRLEKYGFASYIAAPPALLHEIAGDLAATSVRMIAADMSSPLDFREAARLIGIFRREKIDLLHCHLVIASFCSSPEARIGGVKAVIETCHGRETWREGKWLKGNFWFDRQIGRLVDQYIAVSDAVAAHLGNSKGIPPSKIAVIRNGRDLSLFRPASSGERARLRSSLGISEEERVALLLGRLSEEKGQALAIEALSSLAIRWPRLLLLLAGSGPSETDLRKRAEEFGVANRVRFLGYRADAPQLLSAADLVVMPSLSEGLPLVAIEALATARAVVATRVGGTPEVITDGVTGLLVAPDRAELAAGVERVLADPALANQLGSRGRKFVEMHFDIEKQVQQTASLYMRLLGSSESSHSAGEAIGCA
jgi:glycosyltransferase involved in cell wall biosynthesis